MKKKVKDFIAQAVPRYHDEFHNLFVIDSERIYDGFFGKNGYNNIILIGKRNDCEDYELITDWSDAVHVFYGGFDMDIHSETGIIHLWSNKGFKLHGGVNSSVIFNADDYFQSLGREMKE